jgi:hypothetical protein
MFPTVELLGWGGGSVYKHLQSGESLSVRDLQLGCASCGARGEHDLVVAMYEADDGEPDSVSLAAGSSSPRTVSSTHQCSRVRAEGPDNRGIKTTTPACI